MMKVQRKMAKIKKFKKKYEIITNFRTMLIILLLLFSRQK